MRRFQQARFLPLWVAVAVWLFGGAVASAQPVDINLFVNELAPYGQWIQTPQFGQAWIPRDMPSGWRPYTDGRWVWTDEYGWTWASNEEWGWAPFHYGRWFEDARYGWMWIPGTQWAPAWVAWRTDNDHVGWAPLPPQVRWRGTSPLRLSDRDYSYFGRDSWNFVDRRRFIEPDLRQYVLPIAAVLGILPRTRNVTYYAPVGGSIVNRSIGLPYIEQVVGMPVPRMRVERVNTFDDYRARRHDEHNFYVYEPRRRVEEHTGGPVVTERDRLPRERSTTSLVQVPTERTPRHSDRVEMRDRSRVIAVPPPAMGDYRKQTHVNRDVRMKDRTPSERSVPVERNRDTRGMKDRTPGERGIPVEQNRDTGGRGHAEYHSEKSVPANGDRGAAHGHEGGPGHDKGGPGHDKGGPDRGNR